MSVSAGDSNLIASGTTGAGAAMLTTVNEYAAIIGLFISALSLLFGIWFKIMEMRSKREALSLSHEALRQQLKDQLIEEIKQERDDANEQASSD